MHFATFLPDWNSLDSVRRVHSDLELAAIVFFAILVVFDVLAHLIEKRERLFEKIGLYFFAVAVISEAVAYKYGQRNDELSAQVIGSLDSQAKDASQNAAKALCDSHTALSNSQQAIQAQEELVRLKTPRSLIHAKELVTALRGFKGTRYNLNTFPDDESIQFARSINNLLHTSGWVRKQDLEPGAPTANVFGEGQNDLVNLCIDTGIHVFMGAGQNPQALVSLSKHNLKSLPKNLQTAIALRSALPSHISPPDERNVGENVNLMSNKAEDLPMRICVGEKPYTFVPVDKAKKSIKTHANTK